MDDQTDVAAAPPESEPSRPRPRGAHAAPRAQRSGSFWKELPILLLIAFGLAFLVKTLLVQAFFIPSGSMQKTLEIGDRVLVNKVVYHLRPIARGDVVVFNGVDSFTPEVSIVEKIELVSRGDVRRAKLYYLRDLRGKAAKIKEKRNVTPAR